MISAWDEGEQWEEIKSGGRHSSEECLWEFCHVGHCSAADPCTPHTWLWWIVEKASALWQPLTPHTMSCPCTPCLHFSLFCVFSCNLLPTLCLSLYCSSSSKMPRKECDRRQAYRLKENRKRESGKKKSPNFTWKSIVWGGYSFQPNTFLASQDFPKEMLQK